MKKRQKSNHNKYLLLDMICLVLLFIYRYVFSIRLGEFGNGYYAVSFEIFFLLYLLFFYPLSSTVCKMVQSRLDKGQTRRVDRVVRAGIIYCLVLGGFFVFITFFCSDYIMTEMMHVKYAQVAFKGLGIAMLLLGMIQVFLGIVQAMGNEILPKLLQLLGVIILFISTYIGMNKLQESGVKVSNLLKDTQYEYGYMVAGVTVGIIVAGIILFILLMIIYSINNDGFARNHFHNKPANRDTIGSLIREIILKNIKNISNVFGYYGLSAVNICIFLLYQSSGNDEYIATLGNFHGQVFLIMQGIIFLLFVVCQDEIHQLILLQKDKILWEQDLKVIIKKIFMVGLFIGVSLAVLANSILELLFGSVTDSAVTQLQIGGFIIGFFYLSYFLHMILYHSGREKIAFMNCMGCFILQVIIAISLMVGGSLGIEAILWSGFIYCFLSSLLNYLALQHDFYNSVDYFRIFAVPLIGSVVVFLMDLLIVKVLSSLLGGFTIIVAIFISLFGYLIVLILFNGLEQTDLKNNSGGKLIQILAILLHKW